MASAASSLAQAVRAADPDRYLSALYAPADRREALFSLYAFNAEIAAVRDRVSEALPGEIRLQWWRDALAAGTPTGHPVADALLEAVQRHRLPVPALENFIEARVFDLYDDPMPSRTDLEGYCGETAGTILQLAAMVLDDEQAPRFAALAGRAACAQAIAGLLVLLPIHRARGQCYVPVDILDAAGSSREAFLAGGEGAARAVSALTALARDHLAAFERGAGDLPQSLRPAFLPLAVTAAQLARMGRPEEVLAGIGGLSPWRRHWTVLRRAVRGWPD